MTKTALLEGLQRVQNVVSIRSTLPVLSNVLIAAEKNAVLLTTTDLDVTIRCTVEANVEKSGTTTLPVRRLSGIVRELGDVNIEIEVDDKKNAAKVECGSSFFKILGLPEDEFPPVPQSGGKYAYKLDQGVFREMLRKTAYAASTDETRYVLNGVLLSFKGGKLTVVATDGRRLALVEHETDVPKEAEKDMILPSKAVTELLHTLADEGELKIHQKDGQIIFEYENMMLASKLIDGTYPNYKQVIPGQCEERVAIERESLFTALKRVSILTTDTAGSTKLTFAKNKLLIVVNAPDVGEARESLPIKYSGKEITIAFNPEYMMDPLKNLTNDEVFIELIDELSPGVLKCDIPFLYVLMPMRVS